MFDSSSIIDLLQSLPPGQLVALAILGPTVLGLVAALVADWSYHAYNYPAPCLLAVPFCFLSSA